jgi:hypothetical protein
LGGGERPLRNNVGEGKDNYKKKARGPEDRINCGDNIPQYFEQIYYFTFVLISIKL